MIKTITSQIEKAWQDTGKEFSSAHNPKCVFWTEQASLKHPFYFNLRRRLDRSGISQKVAVVPEYRPNVPLNAMCGDRLCLCTKARRRKEQIHIDLCLVEFEKKIHPSDIKYKEDGYRNMWCFKPHPIVSMEFKYYYKFDEWLFNEDIKKLLTMEKVYGSQLLYICFATYEHLNINMLLKYVKQKIGRNRSLRKKFRLAAGTLKKNDWKILQIK